LILTYLRNEATYKDLYSDVWSYATGPSYRDFDARDTASNLVAKTQVLVNTTQFSASSTPKTTGCKRRTSTASFTASGKKAFTHRVIVSTTNHWSEHAEDALRDQQPPVSKIDLHDLENSQIDWAKYRPNQTPSSNPRSNCVSTRNRAPKSKKRISNRRPRQAHYGVRYGQDLRQPQDC